MENKKLKKSETPTGSGNPILVNKVKPKNSKKTFKKLLQYMGAYKIAIIIATLFTAASTIFSIVGPKIMGNATTEIFKGIVGKVSGDGNGINFANIWNIVFILIIFYLISAVFLYIQSVIVSIISNRLTIRLRSDINQKIHKLPFSYFDTIETGDVLSRITNDVDTINQSFSQSFSQIIQSFVMLVGILFMMFSISWQLTLVALGTLPVSFAVVGFIISKSQKHFASQQKYLGTLNGHVEEQYGAQDIIKVFNHEEESYGKFKESNNKLFNASRKATFLSGMMFPIMIFIGNVGYVVICILGGFLVSGKVIEIGDIQAFILYMRQFTQPISQLSQVSNILQQTLASSERVFDFIEEKEIPADSKSALVVIEDKPKNKNEVKINGNVEFKKVSFGYKKGEMIINNFSLKIKKGQKIAIVGPTGAGKTTIVKLLMRFYDINTGSILIDGNEIKKFKRDELKNIFGMVLQDTWLYNASILENIRYGNLDATDEEVIQASKVAQSHHFIKTLPNSYNLEINEEMDNISQGQKQLLTIARTVLSDPKVLILDEATSNVDTRTELLIQKAMDNLMEGRTSFVIAHRLSTIINADSIIVMDKGDIIETGNHKELMKKKGFYAKLYNSQFSK